VGARSTLSAVNNRKIIVPAGKRNQIPLQGRMQGGAAGLQPSPPNLNFKNTDFVDTILSSALRDLTLSLNEALKSVYD